MENIFFWHNQLVGKRSERESALKCNAIEATKNQNMLLSAQLFHVHSTIKPSEDQTQAQQAQP
jgi:hypothetical protein